MILSLLSAVLLTSYVTFAKTYDKCELANELRFIYDFPDVQISTWICIAQHESHFDTSATNRASGDHGIFQISQLYWCEINGIGYACNANCASFRDDDIGDDVECIKKIFKEHTRISGDGFNAWTTYGQYCKGDTSKYLAGCLYNEIEAPTTTPEVLDEDGYHFPALPSTPKVYERCELAKELQDVYGIPQEELSTWVCIAQHESSFNTSVINKAFGDHGLFQISELYWCSTTNKDGGCNARCSQFTDGDITDDVSCIRTIFNEHKAISGDGFNAWSIYPQYCKGNTKRYIGGCPGVDDTIETKKQSKKLKLLSPKVYRRCELAQELKYVHNIREEAISKWVCIAQHESNFDTSALGQGDHGLFQISQQYWCSPYGKGSGCNAKCEDFRDGDITDDIACIQTIYKEHLAISGDGYDAWVVYSQYCKGNTTSYTQDCFNNANKVENNIYKFRIASPASIPNYNAIENNYKDSKKISSHKGASFSFVGGEAIRSLPAFEKRIKKGKSFKYKISDTPIGPSSAGFDFAINDSFVKSLSKKIIQNNTSNATEIPISSEKNTNFSPITNSYTENVSTLKARQQNSRPPPIRPPVRPPFAHRPTHSDSKKPPGPPRPPRPPAPSRPSTFSAAEPFRPSVRPQSPPRPTGPSRPVTGRPRPPPPTTARPFNWNNLPGVIFTLWPSSTTGRVSTSVYSTSPKPPVGTRSTLGAPGYSRASRVGYSFGDSIKSSPTLDGNTVKREQKRHETYFPGYTYSRTKLGGPIMVSFPHLLYGNEEYINSVEGMQPDKSKHQSYIILEPFTGLPLYGAQRIQFNMFLRPVEGLESSANMSRTLLPLLWVEEIVVIPDKYIDVLQNQLFQTLKIINIVRWAVLVMGVACFMIVIVLMIYRQTP